MLLKVEQFGSEKRPLLIHGVSDHVSEGAISSIISPLKFRRGCLRLKSAAGDPGE